MEDEKFVYIQDIKEKKSVGRSARNRRTHAGKGGAVRFPSDFMTIKEKNAMNGEVKSYKLNSPMTWREFRAMPDDLQVIYIKSLRRTFCATDTAISQMFGIGKSGFCRVATMLGLSKGQGSGNHSKMDFKADEWEKWLNRGTFPTKEDKEEITVAVETPAPEPVEISEPKTEEQIAPPVYVTTIPHSGNLTFCGNMVESLHTALLLLEGAKGKITISWECDPV